MASFYGIVLILCTITLLILAIRQHKIVSEDKPFDDSRRQIDFDDFYGKLRKFIGNKQEKIPQIRKCFDHIRKMLYT